jgi:hypothetical protein
VQHLERHVGRISETLSTGADGELLPVTVALLEKGPVQGARTLATVGLSETPLLLAENGNRVRQELVILFREGFDHQTLPGVLQQIAIETLTLGRALLRGEVLGPRGQLVHGYDMTALYVSVPTCFRRSFHVYEPEDEEPVFIAWLFPITTAEARFVEEQGFDEFERELECRDPDLLDFDRPSIA